MEKRPQRREVRSPVPPPALRFLRDSGQMIRSSKSTAFPQSFLSVGTSASLKK